MVMDVRKKGNQQSLAKLGNNIFLNCFLAWMRAGTGMAEGRRQAPNLI